MDIQILTGRKVKVTLTREDMSSLNITYDSLDELTAQTRLAVLKILAEAKRTACFQPKYNKLIVEAFPEEKGGCTLYITAIDDNDSVPKVSPAGPVVFHFSDIQLLIEAASKLFSQYCHRIYKSSLYRIDDDYFLIIYPLDQAENVTTGFLQEYAKKTGEGEIYCAMLCEHGTAVMEENALEMISKFLY